MNLNIVIEPEAEDDILDAYVWYETREGGLGKRFVDQLDLAFERIASNPESY